VKFNFDHLSYSDIQGYSMLKKSSSSRSDAERSERGIRAGKLLDTLLGEPKGGLRKKDSVSDFYSAIGGKGVSQYAPTTIDSASSSTQKINLAINKNTADRHGRT
jgi:hypothetical protein|tara:strand:- start:2184 stop:2498 length:315 start_codon:yes stop_codon:yes gene_type:complete